MNVSELPYELKDEVEEWAKARLSCSGALREVLDRRLSQLAAWCERGGYAQDTVVKLLAEIALLNAALEQYR